MHQASFYCPQCRQMRLFQAEPMSHAAHILASVFLCGLWLPIWILLALSYTPLWRCAFCGFSDQVKYLANPNLRNIEQKAAADAEIRRQMIRDEATGLSFSEQVPYYFAMYRKEILIGAGACIALAGLITFAAMSDNRGTASSSSNQARSFTSTPTPAPTATPKPKSPKEIEADLLLKRKAFVDLQERAMLSKGFNMELKLRGKRLNELQLTYSLVNRAWIYQFQEKYPEFMSGLKDLGFVKMHFSDGFDSSWTVDL